LKTADGSIDRKRFSIAADQRSALLPSEKNAPHNARMPAILTPTSPGELIDKITILQIKRERFTDAAKIANVKHELAVLEQTRSAALPASTELAGLFASLKEINEKLWDVEDAIRLCDRAGDFGPRFIELARAVYQHNDIRCALKRQINQLLGSELVEEKGYRAS
jgi:hypothetical protein